MERKLKNWFNLLHSATFRQSLFTTSVTIVNGLLGAIFFILVARFLGPTEFGLFSIAIATTSLIADIADFGTNTGIVRFVPKYLIESSDKAYKLLKLSLEVKAVVWLMILVSGYFLAPFIAQVFFDKPSLAFSLQLALIGAGGAMLFSFVQSSLQAFQKYRLWSLVNISANFLRLLIFGVLGIIGLAGLTSSLFVYIGLPFFGFLLGLCFLPTGKIISAKNEVVMFKDFRNFNVAVGIFTVIAAFSGRIDTYLGARLLSPQDLGIYGAAVQLNSFILQIIGAIGVVVAPKFASFDTLVKMTSYLKKLQVMVLLLVAILLLGSPLASVFLPWFYGNGYESLPLVFILYLIGMLIYLIAVPVHTAIFYYYARPQVFIYVALGHLLLVYLLGIFLTQQFGIVGLTLAVVAGMVFNLLVPLFYVLNRIKKGK